MRSLWWLCYWWAVVALVNGQGTFLSIPVENLCDNRPRGWNFNGHNYFFTGDIKNDKNFVDETGAPKKFKWLEARNVCRERCMDAVGMETKQENDMIFNFVNKNNLTYIWTSGRLCDFDGCDRADLKPKNILGWFWSNTNTKMAPTNSTPSGWNYQPWSQTGHTGAKQPDNAEFDINQTSESCMGVLNNIYKDGIKWHDIACYHQKPVICEDNDDLLRFIDSKRIRPVTNTQNNNFNGGQTSHFRNRANNF
ncbi:hypothetical protein Pcinc_030330 [Petrolisthes cinctipes]|uniref:C-type lectin domain-containing protein n=1 Tax=Petrolisthes cinctipes TaxID=88211 RepID=A0AAE1EZH8_PETCI|nr:hypothetical protein Pcinc_030330 [Petrolisthes cinctipes]